MTSQSVQFHCDQCKLKVKMNLDSCVHRCWRSVRFIIVDLKLFSYFMLNFFLLQKSTGEFTWGE